MGAQGVVRAHPGFTNEVPNVPRPSDDEMVYGDELTGNGQEWMVGPEQKASC